MNDPAVQATVSETPVAVTIQDNTTTVTVTDNSTTNVSILEAPADVSVQVDAKPTVTILLGPVPAHTHAFDDVATHTHPAGEVDLSLYSLIGHTHAFSELTGIDLSAYALVDHTHTYLSGAIGDLEDLLDAGLDLDNFIPGLAGNLGNFETLYLALGHLIEDTDANGVYSLEGAFTAYYDNAIDQIAIEHWADQFGDYDTAISQIYQDPYWISLGVYHDTNIAGVITSHSSRLDINETQIDLNVTSINSIDGRVTTNTGTLTITSERIDAIVNETLVEMDEKISENEAGWELTAYNLSLYVTNLDLVTGTANRAEIAITDLRVEIDVQTAYTNGIYYSLQSTVTQLSNYWGVAITEDGASGINYIAGISLTAYGTWTSGVEYPIGAEVYQPKNGLVYTCAVNHIASTALEPGYGAFWSADWAAGVAASQSSFIISANEFYVINPDATGSSDYELLFAVSGTGDMITLNSDIVYISGTLLIGAMEDLDTTDPQTVDDYLAVLTAVGIDVTADNTLEYFTNFAALDTWSEGVILNALFGGQTLISGGLIDTEFINTQTLTTGLHLNDFFNLGPTGEIISTTLAQLDLLAAAKLANIEAGADVTTWNALVLPDIVAALVEIVDSVTATGPGGYTIVTEGLVWTDLIVSSFAAFSVAAIGTAFIETAHIGDLQVDTHNINTNAVTKSQSFSAATGSDLSGSITIDAVADVYIHFCVMMANTGNINMLYGTNAATSVWYSGPVPGGVHASSMVYSDVPAGTVSCRVQGTSSYAHNLSLVIVATYK